jgi:hypothetical protein
VSDPQPDEDPDFGDADDDDAVDAGDEEVE